MPETEALRRTTEELARSEERYRYALMAGRLVHWETDVASGTRLWREDAMALFGLKLEGGIGKLGGDDDEFRQAVHPEDRHLVTKVYDLAETQDWFPVEYRIIRPDGSLRWLSGGGQVVTRDEQGKPQRLVHVVADITERKNSEEHIYQLLRELTHRGKNLLAVIQAIASQTGRQSDTIEEFQESFTKRLQGLAASHDLLVVQNWKGAALTDLMRDQLRVFANSGSTAIEFSGPEIFVDPHTTEQLGLALHELATNAVKHGALSKSSGQVSVVWAIEPPSADAPEKLRITWTERGGPPVSPPTRKGFGHVVFERIVARALGGKVEADFAPDGLVWQLSFPTVNSIGRRTVFEDRESRDDAQ